MIPSQNIIAWGNVAPWAEQRMLAKLVNPGFLADISPLISADEADRLNDESINDAFTDVFTNFIGQLPGDPWARTDEKLKQFGLVS